MAKKVAIIGTENGGLMTSEVPTPRRRAVKPKTTVDDVIKAAEVAIVPLVFKDVPLGSKFMYRFREYKKTSSFAAYAPKKGICAFGSKCQIESSQSINNNKN